MTANGWKLAGGIFAALSLMGFGAILLGGSNDEENPPKVNVVVQSAVPLSDDASTEAFTLAEMTRQCDEGRLDSCDYLWNNITTGIDADLNDMRMFGGTCGYRTMAYPEPWTPCEDRVDGPGLIP